MKKNAAKITFIVVISVALCLCFIGCGGAPKGMDQKTYDLGKQAVSIGNDYLAGKISASDASDKLYDVAAGLYNYDAKNSDSNTKVHDNVADLWTALNPKYNWSGLDFKNSLGDLKALLEMK